MKKQAIIVLFIILTGISIFSVISYAQGNGNELKPYVESIEQTREGMTLWQLIKTGGFLMFVLAFLSIAALAIVIYDFMVFKVNKLVPTEFAETIIQKLEKKNDKAARDMCRSEKNIISNIVMAGLDKRPKGAVLAAEAMENCVRKEIGSLWQNISYLSDIAVISPLVGLLGTVLGMIQAFNVIVVQTAVVKPILLAAGISKAMITTAGGLIVAIPALLFYSYFRGQVQVISNAVESYSTDIIKIIEEL